MGRAMAYNEGGGWSRPLPHYRWWREHGTGWWVNGFVYAVSYGLPAEYTYGDGRLYNMRWWQGYCTC